MLLQRYLELRKIKKIPEYLIYNPKHNNLFAKFKELLHGFTIQLFQKVFNFLQSKISIIF